MPLFDGINKKEAAKLTAPGFLVEKFGDPAVVEFYTSELTRTDKLKVQLFQLPPNF